MTDRPSRGMILLPSLPLPPSPGCIGVDVSTLVRNERAPLRGITQGARLHFADLNHRLSRVLIKGVPLFFASGSRFLAAFFLPSSRCRCRPTLTFPARAVASKLRVITSWTHTRIISGCLFSDTFYMLLERIINVID